MKKKLVVALISAAMVTSMLGACGSNNTSSSSASGKAALNQRADGNGNRSDMARLSTQPVAVVATGRKESAIQPLQEPG